MKKVLQFFTFLLFSIYLIGCSDDDESTPNISLETLDKNKLLELVNMQRTTGCNCGGTQMPPVSPLVWNNSLEKAAQRHSLDMANHSHFDHTGTDGSVLGTRVRETGYSWTIVGENIAQDYNNEETVIQGWLDSPRHCKNIMNADFIEMGVAKVENYWTQVFGTP